MYHEQDEMFEKMSEYISQNEGRSRRLQDRVEELEDALQTTNVRHAVDAGGSGEKARIKQLEAQLKSMRAKVQSDIDASTESFISKQKADARFRQQQQEIEELRAMMKGANESRSSNQVWDDSLKAVVALNGTVNSTTVLSKTNVGMLDRKPPADGVKRRERRSSSTRRRLSRYNSESGASDFEYEIMTAEMDRLADMKRSHETRIGQLRVRSASNSGGTSTKAKLLAAADNLGNTVGGLTDADTMSVVSSDSQALTAAREAARKKHTLSPTAQKSQNIPHKVGKVSVAAHQIAEFMADKAIEFDGGSWDIDDRETNRSILQGIAHILQAHRHATMKIHGIQKGETKTKGARMFTEAYPDEAVPANRAITAQGRVLATKNTLIELGIEPSRLVATAEIGDTRLVQFISS